MLIGATQGKVWGWTRRVFASETCQVEHISAKKGWQCSLHDHDAKHNLFYVLSGKLLVRTHKDGLDDDTVLTAGMSTAVKAGDKHQFVALEDCEVLEVYWVSLDPDDIRRYSQGGPVPFMPVAAPQP